MNETLKTINNRVSLRWYEKKKISTEHMDKIIESAIGAPTAGNMVMYSIIHIQNKKTMKKLAISCDSQPFIGTASDILIFVADFNKWNSYYKNEGVYCDKGRRPGNAEMLLAFEDTMIASENAVIAGESLGIGSCYIGDILENYEYHKELLDLPDYTIPLGMLTFGYYPKDYKRVKRERFNREFIVFDEKYKKLDKAELKTMFELKEKEFSTKDSNEGKSFAGEFYKRKTNSDFMENFERSVDQWFKNWK
ncbi:MULTISPECIES: nitroreductase family protein [Psychrilyobacter]|uniref:Nitroreductase n=1 Tax=Psychrilyobacter piezotolerans TaxID=2293438 RepID=A0ABX9KH54_9FUSO|nr:MULTISPECIES: nitroreductase family protein [Psychrilyobacter]MCS5420726.1 nitroreductase family protein [Psychrilyobacter sp. S5]NDI77998.1 nitroreductase [Psychrilyobacter piezotolerans]RDE61941.1 nitroreductase [Psychrilyobacter sp. S5]REI41167.1 nitroreductase [Psychrilyobacter piezotolerans]